MNEERTEVRYKKKDMKKEKRKKSKEYETKNGAK